MITNEISLVSKKSIAQSLPLAKEKQRIWSLDFAKGFALIYVVVIHILDQLSKPDVQDSLFFYGVYVSGRLVGAAVFMFLMGVSLSMSSRSNVLSGVKRGFTIIIIGYVLNFFRGTLPIWLGLQSGKFTLEQIEPHTPLYLLLEFDILPFAGIALIILVVLKHFLSKPLLWALVGFVVVGLTPLIDGLTTGISYIDFFISPLWGMHKNVYFPMFPWLAYPIFGYVYGYYLKKNTNKRAFIINSIYVGLAILLFTSPMLYRDPELKSLNWHKTFFYFRNTAVGSLWFTGFVCLWLAFCYFLVKIVPPNVIFNRLFYWSKNVTTFYCIQWIIIGWIGANVEKLSMGKTVILIIGMMVVTDILITFWNRGIINKR